EAAPRRRDPFRGPGDWYVVHTYAGYENKVKANLSSRISSMQMQDKIFDVEIPMEDVMEIKGGKKQVVQKKVFPGYLLVKMVYDNDSWYVVRNTPGVTGFVSSGTGTKPTPKGGQATPAPPVGTALGQHGVNIMDFCRQYNEQTQQYSGQVIPAELTIYEDRTFSFITKQPPAAELLKQAAGVEKGSGEPNRIKVAAVSEDQLRQIAERKLVDLNANDVDHAMRIIEGTARSMGIEVRA